MTDDAFEQSLRDWLDRRATMSPPSPLLRERVLGVIDAPAPGRRLPATVANAMIGAGVLLAAVLVVAVMLRLGSTVRVGPGATPPPVLPGPSGIVPGDGLVSPALRLESWLLIATLAVGAAFIARWLWARRLWSGVRVAIVVVVIVVALAAGRLSTAVGLRDQGSHGPGLGFIGGPVAAFGDRTDVYQPGPNGPISFAVVISNDGVAPLTIRGLARPTSDAFQVALVGLGTPDPPGTWTGAMLTDPATVRPFTPVTLWPHDAVSLTVLAATGPCAAWPADPPEAGSVIDRLPLTVDLLGYEWVDEVTLDQAVLVTSVNGCSPQGPITLP